MGSFLGARFGGVGVGVLLESCDSSDDDDGDDTASDDTASDDTASDDTASDVYNRFYVISNMKSRNDLRGLGLLFEKVT